MPRRTIVLCMTAYAAGIAVQHAVSDILSFMLMIAATVLAAAAAGKIYVNMRKEIWNCNVSDEEIKSEAEYSRKVFRIGVCLFTVFFILGTILGSIDENRKSALSEVLGQTVSLQGIVVRVEIKDSEKYDLTLREHSTGEKVLITVKKDVRTGGYSTVSIESGTQTGAAFDMKSAANLTGRVIRVGGAVEKPEGAGNPGGFDYSLYLRSMGIQNVMYVDEDDISVIDGAGATEEVDYSGGRDLRGRWKIMNWLAVAKAGFEESVFEVMDHEAAGFLCGMMFGDDGLMESSMQDVFRYAGTGHLLAVSGLHVGMVYGVFYALMGRPVSFWGNLPLGLMMLCYAAVSGFSPSVVRAVFMIMVNIVARVDHRRYDFLTCVAFCGGTMLLVRPTKLFASGFQLSFMAVLSLCVVMPRLQRYIKMPDMPDWKEEGFSLKKYGKVVLKQKLIQFLLVTVSLQLCLTPLTIHTFHYWSPAGLIVNSPSIALAGVIVPLGMAMMGVLLVGSLSGIWPGTVISGSVIDCFLDVIFWLMKFTASAAEMLVKVLIWLNKAADSVIGFRYAVSPGIWLLVLYYFVLFFWCSEMGEGFLKSLIKRRKVPEADEVSEMIAAAKKDEKSDEIDVLWRPLVVLMAAAVAAASCFGVALGWEYALEDAVFLDVGQGDCCHIKGQDGIDVLCDSGGSDIRDVGADVLIPYFLGSGVRKIDLAVISHLHTDHYGGLVTMSAGVEVERLLLSAAYEARAKFISEETGVAVEDMIFARAGDVIDAGGGVSIRILAPSKDSVGKINDAIRKQTDGSSGNDQDIFDELDENEACLVYQVCYKGKKILFTGDIDSEYEKDLVKIWGDVAPTGDGSDVEQRKRSYDAEESVLSSDILKIAHHGSRFSSCSEFLDAVDPDLSVIQVGNNVYGHPTQEAIDRIKGSGSTLLRNDSDGAVMLDLDNDDIRVFTMK